MYCPINNSESTNCPSRCCRLYNLALSFLGAVLAFLLGIIFALLESEIVAGALSLFVAAFVIIFVVFVVTVLTHGCCNNSTRE